MNTFHHDNVVIHHNGDYSHEARVIVHKENLKEEILVPWEALMAFSKEATARTIVQMIEDKFI